MNQIERAMEQVEQMTPEKGFNLVGLDDFGDPTEQGLYLIGHFGTIEEAQTELQKRQQEDPDERFFIYGAEKKEVSPVKVFMAGQTIEE